MMKKMGASSEARTRDNVILRRKSGRSTGAVRAGDVMQVACAKVCLET